MPLEHLTTWSVLLIRNSLASKYIKDLAAIGPSICEKLWEIEFVYIDVGYGAHNDAKDLIDDAIKLLVQSCPGLRCVKLPATFGLTYNALVALFENCPNLSEVEIINALKSARNKIGAIFA